MDPILANNAPKPLNFFLFLRSRNTTPRSPFKSAWRAGRPAKGNCYGNFKSKPSKP